MQSGDYPDFNSLFKDLEHPNPNINYKACIQLVKYWPEESMKRLLSQLTTKDTEIRRKSVLALSEFGQIVVAPVINIYSKDDNTVLRTSCLKILVKLAAKDEINLSNKIIQNIIEKAINESSPPIILTTISLLRQFRLEGLPYLISACRDSNLLKAKAALTAIIEIKDPSIKDILLSIINDTSVDDFIKLSANEALAIYINSHISQPRY